jgi:hypothetical protein
VTIDEANRTLSYRARALAQAHPLSGTARRYLVDVVDRERESQPLPQAADWASSTALAGYCVRQVEEADAGLLVDAADVAPADEGLVRRVAEAAADLRGGAADRFQLTSAADVLDALNHIVATDVERRLDHLRDEVDDAAWDELGEYLAWWVTLGYALRVAEVEPRRATAP